LNPERVLSVLGCSKSGKDWFSAFGSRPYNIITLAVSKSVAVVFSRVSVKVLRAFAANISFFYLRAIFQ